MDSTLSDIFKANHEQNIVEFETTRLVVARYALTQPERAEDWRRTTIFHTYIKCGDKGCKIIIDNGSCIHAVSSNIVAHLGLKRVPHPKPYNVSWVNNTSIAIKERYLFPIKFLDYHDEIWSDVISKDIEHVILERQWIYDLDVIISGRSNSCFFAFKGRKIKLIGLPPRPSNNNKKKGCEQTRT